VFGGGSSSILLTWESVAELSDDEWYGLSVRYLADGVLQYAGTWTKETSWLVPHDLFTRAGENEREFTWDVTVMLQTGSGVDGGRVGTAISLPSQSRTFLWR
jgi:hypothetical protein